MMLELLGEYHVELAAEQKEKRDVSANKANKENKAGDDTNAHIFCTLAALSCDQYNNESSIGRR